MRNGRDQRFGLGLGIGVVFGLFLGSILVSRLGNEVAEVLRSATDRLLHRTERVRFEVLLQ